jgi:hypothetical protein
MLAETPTFVVAVRANAGTVANNASARVTSPIFFIHSSRYLWWWRDRFVFVSGPIDSQFRNRRATRFGRTDDPRKTGTPKSASI